MIHNLEVGPELDLKALKKLSRRYAMTGGYRLTLKADLTLKNIEKLFTIHSTEALSHNPQLSTFRSNNSFRILKLISEYLELNKISNFCFIEELKNALSKECLWPNSE